jgi:hypothetical protein
MAANPFRTRMLVAVTASAALAGAASAVTVAAHAAAAGCAVKYAVTSQWTGGFGASVELRNLGDPLTNWTLTWSFGAGQQVTQAWNTALTQSASAVTARNAAWNGSWRPQLVVVFLGTNDFSTALNPGEPWTADSLVTAYRSAYSGFLQKLRTRYGANTTVVAIGATPFADHVQQVVQERTAAGDSRVRYWFLDGAGLDLLGCHWHYSTRDDQLIADRLTTFIGTLPLTW